MGASASGMKAADKPAAESLLTAFKALSAAERRRHASVLNYWLSVRGDKEFPPLHDLDPLELSDAGPSSILLELISGGHDAEIRHLGEALREEAWPERIIDAPNPSVLSCIAKKLPIVAISRDFLAFEDEYETQGAKTRCSVTLLPLSAGGAWVDYVYALVSVEQVDAKAKSATPQKAKEAPLEIEAESPSDEPRDTEESLAPDENQEGAGEGLSDESLQEPQASEPQVAASSQEEEVPDVAARGKEDEDRHEEDVLQPARQPAPKATPGFSKLLDSLAGLTGFYGSHPVKVQPIVEQPSDEIAGELEDESSTQESQEAACEDSAAEEALREEGNDFGTSEPLAPQEVTAEHAGAEASVSSEGSLQNKLSQVRAKTDEARMARLRANSALYEGLGAAYDFALDAEEAPEEYLRLVEAQGLKIQLRSPMKPVVKLAFAGMCDEPTIKQLEAVLAWAFEQELPRGALAERIEAAGGIAAILSPESKAA
ncbi:MAG TPA: hypothetical protein VE968_01905 [Sphingomicrobium sp.]|nr:hypothetical protein [Sphingomicrobium sp.]